MRLIGGTVERRIALTFLDQVISSVSNFVPGVVLARLAGAAQFGDYMLAFLVWVVVVGVHRSVVTEPLMIINRPGPEGRVLVADGVTADLLVASCLSAAVGIGGVLVFLTGGNFGLVMLALSPWVIPLLLQDYWRAMAFREGRPELAVVSDGAFAATQTAAIGAFVAIGWHAPAHMIAAWGIGGCAGAVLGFRWFPRGSSPRRGWRLLSVLRPQSQWMAADFVTAFAAQQGYLAVAALLLARAEYGGFRAALGLMGPTIVVLHAAANIGLPEASRRVAVSEAAAFRRVGRLVSAGTFSCIGLYGAVIAVAGGDLLRILYGPEFVRFGDLAILAAVQYSIASLLFGQEIVLKAAGRMRGLWRARIMVVGPSLISLILLVGWLGTIGVGWAGVCTGVYYTLAVGAAYRLELSPSKPGKERTGPDCV